MTENLGNPPLNLVNLALNPAGKLPLHREAEAQQPAWEIPPLSISSQ